MSEKEYVIKTKNDYFDFDNVEKNVINVDDIANALSKINRFTGHTNRTYNVAQHSLYVEFLMKKDDISPRLRLIGLIHDFHEAYFSDLSSPLKWYLRDVFGFDANEYCDRIDRHIFNSLGVKYLTDEEHEILKKYDYMAYEHERECLFDKKPSNVMNSMYYPNGTPEQQIQRQFYGFHGHFFRSDFTLCKDALMNRLSDLLELNGL